MCKMVVVVVVRWGREGGYEMLKSSRAHGKPETVVCSVTLFDYLSEVIGTK